MYKNILVPVALEHERRGAEALAVARALRDKGGAITLLHVMEPIPEYLAAHLPDGTLEKNRAEARAEMKAMVGKGGGAEVKLVTGHPSQSILDCADEVGADLIVIASHRPGLEQYFLGSTAARVVRHAECSVHVIR